MRKILIIENDPVLSVALEKKFAEAGFFVTTVRDGGEALHKPTEIKPDAILLDPILPTMSGRDLMETWRHNPATANIPIFAIAKSENDPEENLIKESEVIGVIHVAQLDPAAVLAAVESHLTQISLPQKKDARLAGKKILWTEDDIFLRDLVAAKLAQEGCVSFYAKNGEECLDLLKKPEVGVPDVILLDLILPGMSGFDVLARLRENASLKDVPIVIISNLGQKEDIEKTRSLGARKHIVKAESDPDELIDAIVEVLT